MVGLSITIKLEEAYRSYRQAVILLSKFGFTPNDVWQMSSIEVAAWISSYCESLGIKPKAAQDNVVKSARIPLSEIKKQWKGA